MKLKVNPLFFVTLFVCSYFGNPLNFLITYVTLAVHELVHLYFLYREKIKVEGIILEPFGICIKTSAYGNKSPKVFLSAPFFNILLAFLFYIVSKKTDNSLFLIISASNFVLGVFNLMPILPFDGGRAIMCIIKKKKLFVFISFLMGIAVFLVGILVLKESNFNFSLIMIGIFIIANSFSEREQIFEKAITETKNRFSRKITDKILTRVVTVPFDYNLHKLVSSFENEYFYMVNILKDGIILATLPETVLIDGVIQGKRNLGDFI